MPVDELDEYVAFRYLDAVPEELELLPEFLFPAEFQAWKECTVIPDVLEKHSSGFYNQAPPGYDETKLFQTNKHPIFREVKSFVMRYFTDRVCESTDLSLVTRILMDDAWRDTYRKGEGERQVIPADLITKHYLRYHRV